MRDFLDDDRERASGEATTDVCRRAWNMGLVFIYSAIGQDVKNVPIRADWFRTKWHGIMSKF